MINICINKTLTITATCRKCGIENGLQFNKKPEEWEKMPLEIALDKAIWLMCGDCWEIHAETGKAYCPKCKGPAEGAV